MATFINASLVQDSHCCGISKDELMLAGGVRTYRFVQRKRLKRHAFSFKAVICNAFILLFSISLFSGVKVGFQMLLGSHQAWGESSRTLL